MEPTTYFYQVDIQAMTTPDKIDAFRKLCEDFFTKEGIPGTYGQAQHLRGLNIGPMDAPAEPTGTAPADPVAETVPSEA